jgi:FK506-binding protein 2
MKAALYFGVLASAALGFASAAEVQIDVTQRVKCDRKTQKGDSVEMHYHGSLADTGAKFDASA